MPSQLADGTWVQLIDVTWASFPVFCRWGACMQDDLLFLREWSSKQMQFKVYFSPFDISFWSLSSKSILNIIESPFMSFFIHFLYFFLQCYAIVFSNSPKLCLSLLRFRCRCILVCLKCRSYSSRPRWYKLITSSWCNSFWIYQIDTVIISNLPFSLLMSWSLSIIPMMGQASIGGLCLPFFTWYPSFFDCLCFSWGVFVDSPFSFLVLVSMGSHNTCTLF